MSARRLIPALVSIVLVASASIAWAVTPLTTQLVTTGLTRPVYVVSPPGDTDRLFIIEQRAGAMSNEGRIRIYKKSTATLLSTPYLSISGLSTQNEQGLLGMAFHPDYSTNGYVYVNFTQGAGGGSTFVRRYQVSGNPDVANAASATPVLSFTQPQTNHNAGWMHFGPDGYLYIASGDGGNFNDSGTGHSIGGNAQDITSNLLGKMLRIDVNTDGFPADANRNYGNPPDNPFVAGTFAAGDDEIWSYGLRNPWRNSFDRLTGDMYIGDVGQDAAEEVSYEPAGTGGRNYGWRCFEGNSCTGLSGCDCNTSNTPDAPRIPPIHAYSHPGAGVCAVTGGYVYRGSAIPSLQGAYFFADYCSNQIWSFKAVGGVATEFTERTTELDPPGAAAITDITSFGEDADGEIYICDQGGQIYKIVPNCTIAVSMHPSDVTTCETLPATFTAAASGTVGMTTYQWLKNGMAIMSANSPTYAISSVTAADAGAYRCRITDTCNEVTTLAADLVVTGPQPPGDITDDCLVNAADILIFIDVLLGDDTTPAHVAASDLNGDLVADGDDIPLMVDSAL